MCIRDRPHTEGSLGYTLLMPEEDKTNLRTRDELMAKIAVSMGGRAPEEVVMNTMTNGASQDIQEATGIARNMVAMYGICLLYTSRHRRRHECAARALAGREEPDGGEPRRGHGSFPDALHRRRDVYKRQAPECRLSAGSQDSRRPCASYPAPLP